MSDYKVIPLSEVRPGDIAVCNGREFLVEFRGCQNQVRLGEWYVSATFAGDTLGFEFRRMVPREPREPRRFRVWVYVHPDGTYGGSFSSEFKARNYTRNGGTYFLADIVEVLEP